MVNITEFTGTEKNKAVTVYIYIVNEYKNIYLYTNLKDFVECYNLIVLYICYYYYLSFSV